MKHVSIFLLVIVVLALTLTGCDTADQTERDAVNQQQQQYVVGQPLPQFDWSLERHEMIELYKARNNAVSTYSVVYSQYRGTITFACPSIGYPIPGGTQLTNPSKQAYSGSGIILPQAEPNGLFSPGTSAGTYVMCVNDDGTISPVYIEENVMTFSYPVITDENGRLVPQEGTTPSIKISPNKVP